jgi:hypothetical protein
MGISEKSYTEREKILESESGAKAPNELTRAENAMRAF